MATFQNAEPSLRVYFTKHNIPDIYEALLSGLLIMRPEDPLRFLEAKIKEIMQKGLYSILWNMCIDPELSRKLKVLSDTYLHTLLGLDDDQLMTTELCDRAWDFYSTNLKKKCFDAWTKYCFMRKLRRKALEKKLASARLYHVNRLLRQVLWKWNGVMKSHKEKHKRAAETIKHIFEKTLQKMTFSAWRRESISSKKKKMLAKREPEELDFYEELQDQVHERREKRLSSGFKKLFEDAVTQVKICREHLTRSSGSALIQVFQYLNLIDLARCAQVNRNWKVMTQNILVWSSINFSAVKDVVNDNVARCILLKWRTNVVYLDLQGCTTLYSLTFKNIGCCLNLQQLNVSECPGLNDELMGLVSEGCPALLHLNLSHTNISNGTLRLIPRSFPNLQFLSLAYCRKFTDKGLQYLGNGSGCHKLVYLDISGCLQISVEGFRNLGFSCSGIKYLTINEMPTLTDRCIQALAEKCQKIMSIEFNEAPHVSDKGFRALVDCNLVKIKIEGNNRVTDLMFNTMSRFWPEMTRICVANCQKITDVALKRIAHLDMVIILNLSNCIRIGDSGIRSFVDGDSGPGLRELFLANCPFITDNAIKEIAHKFCHGICNIFTLDMAWHALKLWNRVDVFSFDTLNKRFRCSNLKYLNLSYCQAITDYGIDSLSILPSLVYINLSGTYISDQGLEGLGRQSKIKEIILSECRLITDMGMKAFCTDLKNLDYIDISYCPHISAHSLKCLSLNCHKLTTVIMAGCPKINDVGLQYLAAGCNYLHYLDISGCINIADKGLKCLFKNCAQLRILKMMYCTNISRHAVLKYGPKFQKYEYSDDEPPLWFRYNTNGDETAPLKKPKKRRTTSALLRSGEKDSEAEKPPATEPIAEEALEES